MTDTPKLKARLEAERLHGERMGALPFLRFLEPLQDGCPVCKSALCIVPWNQNVMNVQCSNLD